MKERSDKERIARLARQLAWHQRGMLALVTLIIGVLVLGQAIPDGVIEGRGLVLKDEHGRDRVLLGTLEGSGSPYIFLADSDGRGRVAITLSGTGVPQFELQNSEGGQTAKLALTDDGRPFLHMRSPGGRSASIGISNADSPYVELYQREPGRYVKMSVPVYGEPSIELGRSSIKESERTPIVISLAEDSLPRLEFRDARDRRRLMMGLNAEGEPLFRAFDEHGQKKAIEPSTEE